MVHSPDNSIVFTLQFRNTRLNYSIRRNHEAIVRPSSLGMVFRNSDSLYCFDLAAVDSSSKNSSWEPAWGTQHKIQDAYNAATFQLKGHTSPLRCDLQVRVYNDGCAFRYVFPDSIREVNIMAELTRFDFPEDAGCWWAWADYNTLEKTYQHTPLSKASHVALPFTLQLSSGTCITVAEAAVDDFTTMTLKQVAVDSCAFQSNLVPWSDGVAVKTAGPFQTPWRALFISSNPAGLLESNLLWNLNEPSKVPEAAIFQPIRYVGIWWDMHLGLSTWKLEGGRHGATTARAKKYIDFAEKHGIEGVLVEGWNTGWEHWGQPHTFDFTTPYPDFDLEEVSRYATDHHVLLIGHHETGGDGIEYENRIDSAFALYKRLGIKYVKTGYAGPVNPQQESHHGQYMVRHYNLVMRKAAQYGLALDVHEPVLPSGLGRTYPNLMTFEGVRGMEWNAWSEGNPPSHTCTLPFTRGMAGPIDYTPAIFDTRLDDHASRRVKWNGEDKGRTAVHSTLSNQLALLVVNYSPMQMAADLIENYEGKRPFAFVERLPVSYDESKILAAAVGEYVVVARRKGTVWYIAGITNEQPRELTVDLAFIAGNHPLKYQACFDSPLSHYETNPETYSIQSGSLDRNEPFKLWMAPGGGAMMMVEE